MKGPDGMYKPDPNFVGENAGDDPEDESLEKVIEDGNLDDEEKVELLGFLNENRAERGLPLLNSEFKEERRENDVLDNSSDYTAGLFLEFEFDALTFRMESLS